MTRSSLISQLCYSEASQSPHNHFHLSCEMVYVKKGKAKFVIDGKSYLAGENSIVFISSYEQHEVQIVEKPYCRYFVMVQADELERELPGSPLPEIFKNRPSGFLHCVDLGTAGQEAERIFLSLKNEQEKDDLYSEAMIRNLLEQLLVQVCRICPQNFPELQSGGRVMEIQRYIEQHFTEELQISELADRFFLNHCYLTRLFKEQVGYSPKQYILLNRLSYAKELLETTDLQISQVSCRSGFGDVSNFIRSFRNWFGEAPNRYRQNKISQTNPKDQSASGGSL